MSRYSSRMEWINVYLSALILCGFAVLAYIVIAWALR